MVSSDVERDNGNGIRDAHRILHLLSRYCKDFGEGGKFEVFPKLDGLPAYRYLDQIAGYDGLQIWRSVMRGFALRVQWERNYRTFTIREDRPSKAITEYDKRMMAVEHSDDGYMFPHWTIQAYMDLPGGSIFSIGLAKTRELYPWIKQIELNGHKFYRNRPHNAEETFFSVSWDMYRMSNLFFYEYSPPIEHIGIDESERVVANPDERPWQAL